MQKSGVEFNWKEQLEIEVSYPGQALTRNI